MQSENGGWAAFDADNEHYYLNHIPFADHGALLDPPTADVTARCVSHARAARRRPGKSQPLAKALAYLLRTQEKDGSWYRPLGHELHLWHVVGAVRAQCRAASIRRRRRCARPSHWLFSIQNPDGGWGEDGDSYKLDYRGYEPAPSTASQTAWALLGLMAAGEVDHPAVARGIDYLSQNAGRRRVLGRAALHRDRLPARFLPALSRLLEILSALGAGPLPQSAERANTSVHSGWDVSEAAASYWIRRRGNGIACRSPHRCAGSRSCRGRSRAAAAPMSSSDQLWQRDRRRRRALISFGLAGRFGPESDGGDAASSAAKWYMAGCASHRTPMWASRLKTAIARAELARIAGVDAVSEWRQRKARTSCRERCRRGRYGKPHRRADRSGKRTALRHPARHRRSGRASATAGGACRHARAMAAIDVRAVLVSLAGNPGQLPALMRLAVDTGRARATLLRCHNLLGPGLWASAISASFCCDVTRKHVFGRPLARERDVRRHRVPRSSLRAERLLPPSTGASPHP